LGEQDLRYPAAQQRGWRGRQSLCAGDQPQRAVGVAGARTVDHGAEQNRIGCRRVREAIRRVVVGRATRGWRVLVEHGDMRRRRRGLAFRQPPQQQRVDCGCVRLVGVAVEPCRQCGGRRPLEAAEIAVGQDRAGQQLVGQ
jgi:hypothetical protein